MPAAVRPRACVLGANGFIGLATVEELRSRGFEVIAAVRSKDAAAQVSRRCAEVHVMTGIDVGEESSSGSLLATAVKECSLVVNCAGIYRWWVPDKQMYTRVNCDGARHVAEVLIRPSTSRPSSPTPLRPVWPSPLCNA